ncbi:uncharacterized protein TNCV_964291 [Trichonephila clavipes]|nr:uncharacterized protein TNCV_964291 [Trichonephila clavipes]
MDIKTQNKENEDTTHCSRVHMDRQRRERTEFPEISLFILSGKSHDLGGWMDVIQKIPASDKAHFWLNGYVNKQNCRIWSEANPQVYVETPLHPEKLTVWCALWAVGIIGPYFFKNDEGQIGLHPSQPWQSYARNHI